MIPLLELRNVTRRFGAQGKGAGVTAVQSLSFALPAGQFLAVVGPSGCGKSTILNMVAGLDTPSEGEVLLGGTPVRAPSHRTAFMLQKDLLLPWRSIVANVEFGLEGRGHSRAQRRERAMAELARCRLSDFAHHYPHQLSGGMRQRAALARTLAVDPSLILLDEPFSALDAQTKLVLQRSFAETIEDAGITTLLITHDLSEAVTMADRVLVMAGRPGRLIEDIPLGLVNRRDPFARQSMPLAREHIRHLFDLLHLGDHQHGG